LWSHVAVQIDLKREKKKEKWLCWNLKKVSFQKIQRVQKFCGMCVEGGGEVCDAHKFDKEATKKREDGPPMYIFAKFVFRCSWTSFVSSLFQFFPVFFVFLFCFSKFNLIRNLKMKTNQNSEKRMFRI